MNIYWWSCNTNSQHLIALFSTQNYSKSSLYINTLNSHKDLRGHRGKLNEFLIIKELIGGWVGFGAQATKSRLLPSLHWGCFPLFDSVRKASVLY